jgi:hypothetical protein
VPKATEPGRLGTASHLGLQHHLRAGPDQLPFGSVDAALHGHGGRLRRIWVNQSTASGKARAISQALGTRQFDPNWSLPSLLDRNPLVWMAEVNGMLVDLREMPREVQEIAFQKGMIPYIPADRE